MHHDTALLATIAVGAIRPETQATAADAGVLTTRSGSVHGAESRARGGESS